MLLHGTMSLTKLERTDALHDIILATVWLPQVALLSYATKISHTVFVFVFCVCVTTSLNLLAVLAKTKL